MKFLFTLIFSISLFFSSNAQTYIAQVKQEGQSLWSYVNEKGEVIIEPLFTNCYPFSACGLAVVYEAKTFLFINTKGEALKTEVIGFTLLGGKKRGYHEGMVAIKKGERWGFLDSKGALAIPLKYQKVSNFNGGFAIAKKDNKYLILKKDGTEININTDDIVDIKPFSEGMAIYVSKAKKKGFINTQGEVVIPAKFLSIGNFHAGLAWAKGADKKAGYINKKGEWAFDTKFEATKNFDPVSGLARVKYGGQWSYINKKGMQLKVVTDTYGDFYDGLARGKKGGLIGYFNNKGVWVIAPKFKGGLKFHNGFAAVRKDKKWGFIDREGNWVTKPIYIAIKNLEKVD